MQIYPTINTGAKASEKTVVGEYNGFTKMLRRIYENLAKAFNGQISFGNGIERDNIDGNWLTVTTPATPDTGFTVTHNLGRLPVGIDIKMKNAACDIYNDNSTPATKTQITIKATSAGVNVTLFIH